MIGARETELVCYDGKVYLAERSGRGFDGLQMNEGNPPSSERLFVETRLRLVKNR